MNNETALVLDLPEIDQTKQAIAGGKAASLGALSKLAGIHVPKGFCITTEVFKKLVGQDTVVQDLLTQLSFLKAGDRDEIIKLSAVLRDAVAQVAIPAAVCEEIVRYLSADAAGGSWAVRSSATAEDLPGYSFAGQQDSYLNITGQESVLLHIRKCWASLFTDRAIIYRIQNGFDHDKVQLAVIVQQMVFPQAAGILFTADPVTGHRRVVSIDAGFGLGEAMVSGKVNADMYQVQDGNITGKKIAAKSLAVFVSKDGGTEERQLAPELQRAQVLTDGQILQLEHTGRMIESYFGMPQDMEWCLAGGQFYFVQSRPITTLFPVPETGDEKKHVFISVGHQQMMTDAMKPLGISVWNLTVARPMFVAGGRLFVDVAKELASPAGREKMINVLGKSDPLIKDALTNILEREGFINTAQEDAETPGTGRSAVDFQTLKDFDSSVVEKLIARNRAQLAALKNSICGKSGTALFVLIREDLQLLREHLFDTESFGIIMTGMNASLWLNDKMNEWLGEKNAADILAQSAPGNVTAEMGLELLDVADKIRPYPEVIAYLQQAKDGSFPAGMEALEGGMQARDAIVAFLDKYGMRCAGEIDITRPRWSEKPATLIPAILGNIRNFSPGAGKRKFEQGLEAARQKEAELLERLGKLPDGAHKIAETKRMTGLVRNLIGYREYPKFNNVSRYFVYKQALLEEARRLAAAGVIREEEDIYYLDFEELGAVIEEQKADMAIIDKRKEEFRQFEKLSSPRVMTSDGEIITGSYKPENLPENAIAGLAVSAGVIEGRARVVLRMEDAILEDGDILVTAFTDPGWTPLFVSVKGLVTEVGGLMTHGAVIAREYGLPAIVGIDGVTKRIRDGQRIRVNGTDGYVEIL